MKSCQNSTLRLLASIAGLALLATATATAETISVTDGTGNIYGNATGFAIDFDSSLPALTAPWTPALVNGLTYSLDSVSVRDGNSDVGAVYLGVYSSYSNTGVLSGFLGASTNSVNFSTTTDGNFVAFNFSGINVTADNTPAAGTGLLYFVFQTSQSFVTGASTVRGIHRIDGFSNYTMADYGSNVLAFGALQANRAIEYQAVVTAAIPEPGSFALMAGLVGLGAAMTGRRRRS